MSQMQPVLTELAVADMGGRDGATKARANTCIVVANSPHNTCSASDDYITESELGECVCVVTGTGKPLVLNIVDRSPPHHPTPSI